MSDRPRARWLAWTALLLLSVASAVSMSLTAVMLPRATQAVATPVTVPQLIEEGDRRLAGEDFKGALKAYDDAMALDPSDLVAYYRAGVALSFMDERDQAATLFIWVVRSGDPDREEVRLARQWLDAAQIPVEPTSR